MRDMPSSLNHALKAEESTVDELYYEITVYLDTSVGERISVPKAGGGFPLVGGGDRKSRAQPADRGALPVWLYISAAGLSLLLLILLSKKRRKEDRNGQQ